MNIDDIFNFSVGPKACLAFYVLPQTNLSIKSKLSEALSLSAIEATDVLNKGYGQQKNLIDEANQPDSF